MKMAYSNVGSSGADAVRQISAAKFHDSGQIFTGPATALDIMPAAREVQAFVQPEHIAHLGDSYPLCFSYIYLVLLPCDRLIYVS